MSTKVEFSAAPGHSAAMNGDAGPPPMPVSYDHSKHCGPFLTRFEKVATRKPSYRFARLCGAILSCGMLVAATCLAPTPAQAQRQRSNPQPQTGSQGAMDPLLNDGRITHVDGTQPLSPKQMQTLMQSNLEKLKKDSAELASLAKQLREEVDKPETTTLSLESMNRIDKIEKLAKKIRDEMKGF